MVESINLALSKTLFIDIETVPSWRSLREIPPAPHEEGENRLLEHWERRYGKDRQPDESPDQHFLDKAAIHAIYGRIVCMGLGWLGIHNKKWQWREIVLYDLNEKALLSQFIEIWTNKFLPQHNTPEVATLCGHNLLNFDYIFIGRRMILNGLSLPRPWLSSLFQPHWTLKEVRLIDTMRLWSMGDPGSGSYIGLEVLARILDIPFRKSLTHHEIRERFFAWVDTGEEGYFQPVMDYCAEDVRITAKIYLRLVGRSDLIPYIQSSNIADS